MIDLDAVSFRYTPEGPPVVDGASLHVPEGELVAVIGRTGSGKSTFLKLMNGLAPHFTGGTLSGEVRVAGRSTREHRPRDLADAVGYVPQNPSDGFVTDAVQDELAYAMENLGLAPDVMRRRVEDTLDLLSLHEIRERPLSTLSGGQRQRVAIGSVLTVSPRVLVLDEPTSALDPASAEEVLAALARLVHDVGLSVVVAEHRLERILPFADRVVLLPGAGAPPVVGAPAEVMADAPVAPPVVRLGRLAGWAPLPMSIRDARRAAAELRAELSAGPPPGPGRERLDGSPLATASRVAFRYGEADVLAGVDLAVGRGEIVSLMGRNGSGKTTLLRLLAGELTPRRGRVEVGGGPPADLPPRRLVARVGYVPQDPGLLLYCATVDEECAAADRETGLAPGTTRGTLDSLMAGLPGGSHPRDLSEGQRLTLALAVVLAHRPPLLLLDEPTRGLDEPGKAGLARVLAERAADGGGVVIATHDVEFAAIAADRVVVLAEGEVVTEGPTRSVVCQSPVFSPQVAKVLAPVELLTVREVETALDALEEPA